MCINIKTAKTIYNIVLAMQEVKKKVILCVMEAHVI